MTGKHLTLSQLQERIKSVIACEFSTPVWISAEISEIKVNDRSGHCYLQLVEKGGRNSVPRAQASAVIWAGQYGIISSYFRGATGRDLAVGLNVLLSVTVIYHELYGLSLRIVDIDPLYTLGDLEQQRLQAIAQLREDGVFDLNRELPLPVVIQRIAIVSSPQAAGYQDFINELKASPYRFDTELFGAFMQGHGAEQSIIDALDKVAARADEFDAVVIIRGGGSQSDLSFLNSYMLSFHIAQFPLPILSGLGHDKDQSVVDMVAAISLKTPTAVAAFLADRAAEFDARLEAAVDEIRNNVQRIMSRSEHDVQMLGRLLQERIRSASIRSDMRLRTLGDNISATARRIYAAATTRLDHNADSLAERSMRAVAAGRTLLEQAERLVAAADPHTILSRGYAIIRTGSRAVTDANAAPAGTILDITLHKGKLTAKVTDNGKEKTDNIH